MDKTVLALGFFAAGAGFGFLVGYNLNKKEMKKMTADYTEMLKMAESKPQAVPEKTEEQISENPGSDIFKIKPAKLARPDEIGINYRQYVKDLKYAEETEHPKDDIPEDDEKAESGLVDDDDELDPLDYEETYEERAERENEELQHSAEEYKKEHNGKIELMSSDDWDTDFPEADYEREDLYYFTESDVLTDEDGNQLNEIEYIGPKPRQVGWMRSPDDRIYIRNHPKEKEYRVFKEKCSIEDWYS